MNCKTNYMEMEPVEVYKLVRIGEIKKFPNNYLDKSAIKEIVRYVILSIYKFSREDVLTKLDHEFFMENYMGGFRKFFEFGDNEILIYSLPEWKIKHWEFRKVSPKFWEDKENQKDLIEWIGQKEGWDITTKEGLRKVTARVVHKYAGTKPLVYAGGPKYCGMQ